MLGGVEGIEQPVGVVRRHADAIVAHRETDIAAFAPIDANLQLRLICLDLAHRIHAIKHQVEQHLLDLHPVANSGGKPSGTSTVSVTPCASISLCASATISATVSATLIHSL